MNLFNGFKKRKTNITEELKRHVAGAKFGHLTSYSNGQEITQEFFDKWTAPFYFNLNSIDDDWVNSIIKLKPDISDEIILSNLGDFNWRTRGTGAFFAAIKDKVEFTEIIGTHLLKSEVCYAGCEYAKVLALFNTEQSIAYLEQYLEYYLLKKDLYFDQREVLEALKYVDIVNSSNRTQKHLDNWRNFIFDKRQPELNAIEKMKLENEDPKTIEHLQNNSAWLEDLDTKWIEKIIKTIEKIKVANTV